jgi:hypothetical protein
MHAYPALQLPEHRGDVRPGDDPYRPAAHRLHELAPDRLYVPGPHCTAVPLVDPAGHAYPAVQPPEQPAVARPDDDPYRPAAHRLHELAPPTLNCPATHMAAVGLTDPAAHAYPAEHAPLHWLVTCATALPYRPAAHRPLHDDDVAPLTLPNVPWGHGEHDPAPPTLNVPATHTDAVAVEDPAGHAYPAAQLPVHPDDAMPRVAPYSPAAQGPLHPDELVAVDRPNRPAAHGVHAPDPAKLY